MSLSPNLPKIANRGICLASAILLIRRKIACLHRRGL